MALQGDSPPLKTTDQDLSSLPDEQLLLRHRTGTDGAFELLLERYRQELFHFLIRFSGNRASAEDLFQEAFLQVHHSAHTFDVTKRFKPWLFTIAANKARDLLRKRVRQRTMPLSALIDRNDEGGRSFIDLMEADVAMPDTHASEEEIRLRVRNVVDELPDHLREVILLAYFNKLAYKEIAAMLNIPLGTVKSRLHAAVGTFSQVWRGRYGETPPLESSI